MDMGQLIYPPMLQKFINHYANGYFNVFNIGVQLTASGSVYHYLPGDCLNVASLLVKMDNAMRGVKMNGGNAVVAVTGI